MSDAEGVGSDSAGRGGAATVLVCAALALGVTGAAHLLQRRLGFTVQDEGYLWYGVQAVLRGELPLRDFNSYDPGRYLWCAAFGLAVGPGILALRLACAVFGALGLFFGLLVAQRALGRRWALVPAALVLALWMQPPWKVFEPAIAMTAVWIGTRLVERPDARRHLAAGVFVGLAACFGRNHGLYVAVGLAAVVALVALRGERRALQRRLLVWCGGIALGYAPMLALILLAPGFREAFAESLAYFAQQGHLSGKKPIPWPWTPDYAVMDVWADAHNLGVGCAYLLLPLYYLPSLVGVLRSLRGLLVRRAPWIAATLIGVPYVHHASVHAAYYHLAQAIHPLLLGMLALPLVLPPGRRAALARAACLSGLLALALVTNVPALEAVWRWRMEGTPQALRALEVGEDELLVRPAVADYLEQLAEAVEGSVPPDVPVFLAPLFPGLYGMLGRAAPTWDVYMAWTGTDASQARLVRQLQGVDWALIDARRPFGQEWMHLASSNPRAWELLQREFVPLDPQPRLPRRHLLLRRRD